MKLVISLLALFITVYFVIKTIKLIFTEDINANDEGELIKAEVEKSLRNIRIRNNVIAILTVLYFYNSFMKL